MATHEKGINRSFISIKPSVWIKLFRRIRPPDVQPVAAADRIKSIDAIRGFALLGILLMNIPGFGMNWDYWYPILSGTSKTYDLYTFAAIEIFFDGTMRGLFSMLFGAGMVLFLVNKKDQRVNPPSRFIITVACSGSYSLD